MENPCRYCAQRKAGCGADCTKWAAYTTLRNAEYAKRQRESNAKQGLDEHFRRITRRAEKDKRRGRK